MLGKIEGKRTRRVTEDEMVGWLHQHNGHEFDQAPGDVKDRETWRAAVHGVTKSWTELSAGREIQWKDREKSKEESMIWEA